MLIVNPCRTAPIFVKWLGMTLIRLICPRIRYASPSTLALTVALGLATPALAQEGGEDAEINWQALGDLSVPETEQDRIQILRYPNSDVARVVGPRAFAPTSTTQPQNGGNETRALRQPIGLDSVFKRPPATQSPQPLLATPPVTSEVPKVVDGLAPRIAPSQRLDSPEQTIASAPIAPPVTTNRGARVHFAVGKAELTDAAKASLARLAVKLAQSSGKVLLLGFGDKSGDSSTGARRLSLRRAVSVRRHLIENGVAKDQIEVRAEGAPGPDKRPSSVEIIQNAG